EVDGLADDAGDEKRPEVVGRGLARGAALRPPELEPGVERLGLGGLLRRAQRREGLVELALVEALEGVRRQEALRWSVVLVEARLDERDDLGDRRLRVLARRADRERRTLLGRERHEVEDALGVHLLVALHQGDVRLEGLRRLGDERRGSRV